jgi:hypothetical protein
VSGQFDLRKGKKERAREREREIAGDGTALFEENKTIVFP